MAKMSIEVQSRKTGSGLDEARRDLQGLERAAATSGGQARDAQGRFSALGDAAQEAGGKAERSQGKFAAIGGVIGGFLANAAADAAGALIRLGADSIASASDLQQAWGGAQAVFGPAFAEIQKGAEGAAQGLGLSKREFLDLATTLGAGLKNNGLDDFAGKTQQVIKLGADLAAQYGGSTSDAIAAIGSLMRGEADPIERYGVSIKQSAVNAELASKGLDKLDGAAKTQAESQARLDLLFRQTADAQGAFAREADTAAGSQSRLRAQWEDAKATLGDRLLPALTEVTRTFSDALAGQGPLADALSVTNSRYQDLFGAVNDMVGSFQTLTGAQDDASISLGDVLGFVVRVNDALSGNLVNSLRIAAQAIAEVNEWLGRMSSALMNVNVGGLGTVRDVISGVAGAANDAWNAVSGLIGKIGELSGVSSVVSAVGNLLNRSELVVGSGSTGGLQLVPVPVQVAPPVVNVNVDGLTLRSVIRAEVRAAVSSSGGLLP